MICPHCYSTGEPEWRWKYIQADEAYRIPTCPYCGTEMVESEPCPLCGEPMEYGKSICVSCWNALVPALRRAGDGVAVLGTPELAVWNAIAVVADEIADRIETRERRKRNEHIRKNECDYE